MDSTSMGSVRSTGTLSNQNVGHSAGETASTRTTEQNQSAIHVNKLSRASSTFTKEQTSLDTPSLKQRSLSVLSSAQTKLNDAKSSPLAKKIIKWAPLAISVIGLAGSIAALGPTGGGSIILVLGFALATFYFIGKMQEENDKKKEMEINRSFESQPIDPASGAETTTPIEGLTEAESMAASHIEEEDDDGKTPEEVSSETSVRHSQSISDGKGKDNDTTSETISSRTTIQQAHQPGRKKDKGKEKDDSGDIDYSVLFSSSDDTISATKASKGHRPNTSSEMGEDDAIKWATSDSLKTESKASSIKSSKIDRVETESEWDDDKPLEGSGKSLESKW